MANCRAGSPRSDRSSPASMIRSGENGRSGWDEVDKLGYMHSLRVALLHQYLANAPKTPRVGSSPLPSPSLTGTSPNGSRLTLNMAGKSPTWPSPPPTPTSPPGPTGLMSRRKSSFGLNKKKDDTLKLPKEFVVEFWVTLSTENGDEGWKEGVSSFLGMLKKGATKTPSGLNLREIPVLLDTFTQTLPQNSPKHVHQSHLLNLLYNSLPRSSYFSPIARQQTDKDKDLLFKLRAEVQSYMLSSAPTEASDDFAATAKPPRSPGVALGRTSSSQSKASSNEVRRKPTPLFFSDEMVDTVSLVWGISRDALDRDAEGIKRYGPLEQIYLADLKSSLDFLSSLPSLTTSQQNRQRALSEQISSVKLSFSDVQVVDHSSSQTFFTPPRTSEVFARLTARASEAGHSSKTRDLVERCREIWGIESRRDKEKEVESLALRWNDSIGTREETEWGKHLADGVRDLIVGLGAEDFPPVLDEVLDKALSLLAVSVNAIFPTTDLPPTRPAPSVIPILTAGKDVFLAQEKAKTILNDLSDELKAFAVGEYVTAAEAMGGLRGDGTGGLQKVATWIGREIANIRTSWGNGLGPTFDPAAIVLSRQLPLFCAELQSLAHPSGSAEMFQLYEITGRLLEMWDELCPGQEHGFELDAFFEPHIVAWLKDTEVNTTQDWVSRAVGMDNWIPEGSNKHSQSVIDLFEFIREAAQVILRDLPLGEYKRALYLVDLSKTVSIAVNQYASTVSALFSAELSTTKPGSPSLEIANKFEGKLGGKASSWLAKGQQAVKSLERKKVDGFVIPASACVKLSDMGAAQTCLDDLHISLEADDTAAIVKQHKLSTTQLERTRHVFTVTIMRGDGILTRGLVKGADGFVVITDRDTGERLIKTRTVLGQEDPRWEQSFEVSVDKVKQLELTVYDRVLVGKHDPIGSSTFRLDPRAYANASTRDVILALNPRGTVHLRISMEGGEKHDVAYHLSTASRTLGRTEEDMIREIVDRLCEFIKTVLSASAIASVLKPLRDKKKPRTALSEQEVETSLGPLFEYLNENFGVFSQTLVPETRMLVMLAIWHRIIDILISLLVPPLSDKPYNKEPTSSAEVDLVFKWLQLLKSFFNASEGGKEHGVPITQLQAGNYKDLVMVGQYMDLPTPALRDRCSAAVKSASSKASGPMSIGGLSLNGAEDNERMAVVLLRIARTRPDMTEFLTQQIGTLTRAKMDRQAGVL